MANDLLCCISLYKIQQYRNCGILFLLFWWRIVFTADGEDGDGTGKSPKDKKKNREAQIQAEITKKFGKASLSIRVANFFAGDPENMSEHV